MNIGEINLRLLCTGSMLLFLQGLFFITFMLAVRRLWLIIVEQLKCNNAATAAIYIQQFIEYAWYSIMGFVPGI
jgi:hypothetical protein